MKSQINIILFVILVGLVLLNIGLYIFYSNNVSHKSIEKQILYLKFQNSLENGIILLPYINNKSVNKSLGMLLDYYSMSENNTFCLSKNYCTNITKDLYNYFNNIYGNNWNLTIYFVPNNVFGWNAKMFVFLGNASDFNPCAYNPPDNPNGVPWYQIGYNASFSKKIYVLNYQGTNNDETIVGSGWVNVFIPFEENSSFNNWGLYNLTDNYNISQAIKDRICYPLSKFLPRYNFTNATIYCPYGGWLLFNYSNTPIMIENSSLLPSSYYACKGLDNKCQYTAAPSFYKTATDISILAEDLGLFKFSNKYKITQNITGGFYIGNITIPKQCSQVFIEDIWYGTTRLYISYVNKSGEVKDVFLGAGPYCQYNQNTPSEIKELKPLVYMYQSNNFAYGFLEFNITKYVIYNRDPKTNYFEVSNIFWDPQKNPNGISDLVVFCINNNGNVIFLNYIPYNFQNKNVSIGHLIPPNVNTLSYEFYYPSQGNFEQEPAYLIAKLTLW